MPPGLEANLHALELRRDAEIEELMRHLDLNTVTAEAQLDVTTWSLEAIRDWLAAAADISTAEVLFVWWPFDRMAVQMTRHLFLYNFSDWWSPAQDDLVIWNGRTHLLLEHEEVVYQWSTPSPNHPASRADAPC